MTGSFDIVENLRQEGNDLFSSGYFKEAYKKYEEGLKYSDVTSKDLICTIYLNMAACNLKLDQFEEAILNSSSALKICPDNQKALFRRCCSFEKLEKYTEAFKDSKKLLEINPKSKLYNEKAQTLYNLVSQSHNKLNETSNVFKTLLKNLLNSDPFDLEESGKDLISFLKVQSHRDKIFTDELLDPIFTNFDDNRLKIPLQKLLSLLCLNNLAHSSYILKKLNSNTLNSIFASTNPVIVQNGCRLLCNHIENIILDIQSKTSAPPSTESFSIREKYRQEHVNFYRKYENIDVYFTLVMNSLLIQNMDILNKCQILNMIHKLISHDLYLSFYCLEIGIIEKLVKSTASLIPNDIELIRIDENYRTFVEILTSCLSVLHSNCSFNSETISQFNRQVDRGLMSTFEIKSLFHAHFMLSLFPIVSVIVELSNYVLCESPFEFGVKLLEILNELVNSGKISIEKLQNLDISFISFFAELIVSCKNCQRFSSLSNFKPISQILSSYFYSSTSPVLKLIGLNGLVKQISYKPNEEDPLFVKYLNEVKPFIKTNTISKESCLALEILSFLSLNGDVKESIIHDSSFLESLFDLLSKICSSIKKIHDDQNNIHQIQFLPALFCACAVFGNLINIGPPDKIRTNEEEAYCNNRKELKKLAKTVGQPLPKLHPKDKKAFLNERLKLLSIPKFFSILSQMCNCLKIACFDKKSVTHLSKHCPYYISSLFYHTLIDEDIRGIAAQSGAIKALLIIAQDLKIGEYLPSGSRAYLEAPYIAAHALALIAISINPALSFHGESINESLRPLLCISDFDQKPLRRFEGLMGLTNLVSVNDEVREKFSKIEKSFQIIKTAIFDENEMVKRASVELSVNMMLNQNFVNTHFMPPPFETQKDLTEDLRDVRAENIRLFVLLSGEVEDEKLSSAASGVVSLLSYHPLPCQYIIRVKSFYEIIQSLLVSDKLNLVYRALFIVYNIMTHDKGHAKEIIESKCFEIILALEIKHKNKTEDLCVKINQLIEKVLQKALDYGLIKNRE